MASLNYIKERKPLIVLLVVACIAASSCYKSGPANQDKQKPVYDVYVSGNNGGGDIKNTNVVFEVIDSSALTLNFSFFQKTGNPENYPLTCYIDSLPGTTTSSVDSVNFKLNYNFQAKLNINADTGLHKIKIRLFNPADGNSSYPVFIHVTHTPPPPDCSLCLTGTWNCTDCNNKKFSSVFTPISGMKGWTSISNFSNLGDSISVKASISCDFDIIIPVQTINGYTIWGQVHEHSNYCGFSALAFFVPDTMVHGGDTLYCGTEYQSW